MIKTELKDLAERIANDFLSSGQDLNSIIAEVVLENNVDKKYIRMLVTMVNTEIYLRFLQQGKAKEFPVASVEQVNKIISELQSEPTVTAEKNAEDSDIPVPRSLLLKSLENPKQSKTAEYFKKAKAQKLADLEIEFERKDYHRLPILILAFKREMYDKYGEQGVHRIKGFLIETGYEKEAEAIFLSENTSFVRMYISNDDLNEAIELAKSVKEAEQIKQQIKALKKML